MNHIPPIFGCETFAQVASSYGGEKVNKSFRGSMQSLQNSLKNIADGSLHLVIRKKESLPNSTQVEFRPDFHMLLAEVIRILRIYHKDSVMSVEQKNSPSNSLNQKGRQCLGVPKAGIPA
jgi:hypothetical protein